ncbi:tubulin-specific chaperone cofactor E-like protein [Anopheles funestus]|uniref:tubulin-specific chaperone cofactor E-like protein n=1 Tax=Anopheles funestus TaxID=62324 RepID=UPI0020C5CE4A|nr:tubulin-specific chaperone cofactor E-like protein [Anopheles funestus]XP_049292225.1 tubulin-specific chaperone cofactor E-like protein [Anopheles funestus]XP_049292226.1 tubulin-specific chaperone cofactor E-like protein [Anopheles funestus]XP_049292227.1 tubulin-specific chaperone cofactor E-like protein [Anopheles funestus]XP_049292228.1 tubulin-specific chaperone cofactor E-like protein [Anopheles funestus]XP_049292229.1 tubulin-specific chaperone cofactor E-like protein [Anopheles fun
MPTLLEALEEKYGMEPDEKEEHVEEEVLVSIFVPKLPPRQSTPQLLILNDCNIDRAGEPEDLKKKCRIVKELDLAQNKLNNWNEVFVILSHMPRVEFVNLSLNHLTGPIQKPPVTKMDHLRNLVLNNTKLEWCSVEKLLRLLPALEELHLSLNEYTHVLIDTINPPAEQTGNAGGEGNATDASGNNNTKGETATSQTEEDTMSGCSCSSSTPQPTEQNKSDPGTVEPPPLQTDPHGGVRKLHLTGNYISEWGEICRIGRVFPQLEALVLADCPLRSLKPTDPQGNENEDESHKYFQQLKLLNLSNAKIDSWEDIDRLAEFPSLCNVRLQYWPLWARTDSTTEHERRQLLIARLPNISILNGGDTIGAVEREDAERSFIRHYLDKPDAERPRRYYELIGVHGQLDPLVNIDLRPERKVKVRFTFEDQAIERTVDVNRTVSDLKSRLERLFEVPAARMRLYYVDQDFRDLQGLEEMKYPHKVLYSYNIRSGDEIIIERKVKS